MKNSFSRPSVEAPNSVVISARCDVCPFEDEVGRTVGILRQPLAEVDEDLGVDGSLVRTVNRSVPCALIGPAPA